MVFYFTNNWTVPVGTAFIIQTDFLPTYKLIVQVLFESEKIQFESSVDYHINFLDKSSLGGSTSNCANVSVYHGLEII